MSRRRIVVLHAGGMGDLVLAETLFSALRELNPHARLELICREDVAPIVGLYARPPDAVHPFPFDPYRWDAPSDLIAAEIRAVADRVGPDVDYFISAELRATPLSDALAAVFASPEAIVGDTSGTPQAGDIFILLRKLGLATNPSLRRLSHVPNEHELDRYARLAGALERRRPALRPARRANEERRRLEVFPFASSPLQRWPLERTVAAAAHIAERYDLNIRLVGSEKQRLLLENVAAMLGGPAEIFAGAPAQLPRLAEELAGAFGYIGIDTGLAHLAAAYGVPGVTIYGGGTWPAYSPWQPASAGVLSPIPCFGCSWDCAFERAFCIDGVEVDAVVGAFDAVVAKDRAGELLVEVDAFAPRERAILEAASSAFRKAQADRLARLAVIARLREERGDVIADLQSQLEIQRRAAGERGAVIAMLDEALTREREQSSDARARLAGLEDTALTRGELIVELQRTCEERLALIERLSAEAERRSVLLADMTAAFEASIRELESLRVAASQPF